MKTTYSTFEFCEVTDIPYQRFRQWIRKGDIQLSIEARGHGTKGKLSICDAYRTEQYRRFIDAGYRRDVAAKFIKNMSDEDLKENSFIAYAIETQNNKVKIFPRFFKNKEAIFEHLDSYEWKEVRLLSIENLKRNVDSAFETLTEP